MILSSQRQKSSGQIAVALALFVALFAGPAFAAASNGYLGVHLQDLDDALIAALDLDGAEHGVLVSEVVDDSPAAEAGLERGDVIVEFDGAPTKSVRGLTRRVRRADAGDAVKLQVLRKGRAQTIEVTLGESPKSRAYAFFSDDEDGVAPDVQFFGGENGFVFDGDNDFEWNSRGTLGVRIEDLNSDLGRYFGTDEGVLVMGVNEDSAAEDAGMKAGDVIVSVDGEDVESTGDLHEVLSEFEAGDTVTIGYMRDKKKGDVEVELGEGSAFSMVFPEGNRFRVRTGPRGHVAEGLLRDMRAPKLRARRLHRLHEDGDLESELESLREQLNELREQLEEVRKN
jgi:predicted metalloprotease with PDZ domain